MYWRVKGWDGESETIRTTKMIYDDVSRRYVTHMKDANDQVVSTTLPTDRDRFGNPLVTSMANGNTTFASTDAMGSTYFTRDNTGTGTTTVISWCEGHGPVDEIPNRACPLDAVYSVSTYTAGEPETIGWFDLLAREVRSAQRMFDPSLWSVVVTEYDELGRVHRVSEPFPSGSAHLGVGAHWTTTQYDILGRPKVIEHPISTDITNASYGDHRTEIAYQGLSVESTTRNAGHSSDDSNGVTTSTIKRNHLGETIEVIDVIENRIQHVYDERGNIAKTDVVTAELTTTVQFQHDLLGRKIWIDDPDMGEWRYEYNAYGELIKQTNALNEQVTQRYDSLGRMVTRIDSRAAGVEAVASWEYDNTNGAGFLRKEGTGPTKTKPFAHLERQFGYDQFGRPSSVRTTIDLDHVYSESTTYDEYGRVFQSFDAAGNSAGVEYNYKRENGDDAGYMVSLHEASDPQRQYYQVGTMDARGNITQAIKGPDVGGITVAMDYDLANGLPDRQSAAPIDGSTMLDINYTFDSIGNLKLQAHSWASGGASGYQEERYNYDQLSRLQAAVGDNGTQSFTYHANGNILSKTGVGNAQRTGVSSGDQLWQYSTDDDPHRPHAVKVAGDRTFKYNDNGSMTQTRYTETSSLIREVGYTVFNKPSDIRAYVPKAATVHFDYGPNRARYQRIDNQDVSGRMQTIHYVGTVEKIWRADGTVETKRYIMGEVVVTETGVSNSPARELLYLVKDHQGSVRVLVDESGVQTQQGFDAFGLRRADSNWQTLSLLQLANFDSGATTRGYTGHEMIDEPGLIHMNGRVYDPYLGRFLSADPLVQAPENSQSYNRYSYVFNNPLSYTDPSGNAVFALAAGIAIGAGAKVAAGKAFLYIFLAATADSLIRGASFEDAVKGGLISGASAAALVGLGSAFDGASGFWGNAVVQQAAYGVVGGITSTLQGGKFGHGFLSASLSRPLTSGLIGGSDSAFGSVLAQALVGGAISEATGGKFANGAATAALAATLSEVTTTAPSEPGFPTDEHMTPEERIALERDQKLAAKAIALRIESGDLNPYKIFDSPEAAAKHVLAVVAPISEKYHVEIAGEIRRTRSGYRYTKPRPQLRGSAPELVQTPRGRDAYHTHPNGARQFSSNDALWVQNRESTLFVRGGGRTSACTFGSRRCDFAAADEFGEDTSYNPHLLGTRVR